MFEIDAERNFKCLSISDDNCRFLSVHNGKHVTSIYQGEEEFSEGEEGIPIQSDWAPESGTNYVVRLTKNITLRSRVSHEFLVWF